MAKIELEMKANTQGAVQNLKATQANINKVADAFVKLQNEGVGLDKMNNAVSGFYELVDRLASSMFSSGEAASYFEARMKVLESALQSASQMNEGGISEISEALRSAYTEAENASLAINEMTDAEMELEKEQKATTSVLQKFGAKLASTIGSITIFRTVMNITNAIVNGFKKTLADSIEVAATGEQVYSKLTTVFGEYSNAVQRADEVSAHLGVSSQTAASALSTVGDLLQAQGATASQSLELASEWVEKFQDIIAFKDVDMSLEEFAQNFMSGAAGNLRNFRTFGSIVKESAVNARLAAKGVDQLTGSELELAKMTARAEIALEQQKNAFGATNREWDTMLSVTRRYDEAIKEMEENIGNVLLPELKSFKTVVADIIQGWNDAIAARAAYRNGDLSYNSGKDVKNNVNDYSEFYDQLLHAMNAVFNKEDKVGTVILRYGADINDVNRALKEMADNGTIINSKGKQIAENLAQQRNLAASVSDEYNESKTSLETFAQKFDAVLEKIQTVEGVNFVGSSWYKSLEEALELDFEKLKDSQAVNGKLVDLGLKYGGAISDAVNEAIADINSTKFGTNAEYAFGKADQWTDLEKRITVFEQLYQTMSTINGVSDEVLSSIVTAWEEASEALELHNQLLEQGKQLRDKLMKDRQERLDSIANNRQQNINAAASLFSGYVDQTMDYRAQLAVLGKSSDEATLYNLQMAEERARDSGDLNLADTIGITIEAFTKLTDATKALEESERKAKAYEDAMSSLDMASDVEGRKLSKFFQGRGFTEEYSNAWADVMLQRDSLKASYEDALKNASTDEEIQAAKSSYQASLDYINETFEEEWKDVPKTLVEVTQKEMTDKFTSAGGPFGEMVDTLFDGKFSDAMGSLGDLVGGLGAAAGPVGMLVEEIIKIISSLDVVTRITSLLSDTLGPVLNDFLEPLLPLISVLASILTSLFETVLVPFYPLIQKISKALVFAFGLIDMGVGLIEDSIKFMVSHVVKGFENMVNWVIDILNSIPFVDIGRADFMNGNMKEWYGVEPLKNAEAKWNKLQATLKSIDDNVFGVRENTSDADLSFLDELLAAQIIDEKTYNSRASAKQAGLNWDTVGASTSGYVSAQRHTTEVQAGAIVININGTNDSTEVQRQVYRALQVAGIPVSGQSI